MTGHLRKGTGKGGDQGEKEAESGFNDEVEAVCADVAGSFMAVYRSRAAAANCQPNPEWTSILCVFLQSPGGGGGGGGAHWLRQPELTRKWLERCTGRMKLQPDGISAAGSKDLISRGKGGIGGKGPLASGGKGSH